MKKGVSRSETKTKCFILGHAEPRKVKVTGGCVVHEREMVNTLIDAFAALQYMVCMIAWVLANWITLD